MFGGDEVNSIIVDVGSYTCKAGYGGEDTPKAVFPSVVGYVPGHPPPDVEMGDEDAVNGSAPKRRKRDVYVGLAAANHRRDDMELIPCLKDGLYGDMDHIAAVWDHAFFDRLRIDPREHPILLAEPTANTKELREATVSLMFEEFGVPAMFLAKNSVLNCFATGKSTGISIDCAHEGSVVAAVHDGYVLNKTIHRAPLGGHLLTRCMLASVHDKGDVAVRPRYAFSRKELAPGQFEVEDLSFPKTPESFRLYQLEQIGADMKENVCRVSDNVFDEVENANIPTVAYELPDGSELQIGPDRFKVPEVLFRPELLSAFKGMEDVKGYDGSALQPLQALVNSTVAKCDHDIKREMYTNMVFTGGTSLFSGAKERLEREINDLSALPSKVKVMCPVNTAERRFSVWIGGSILGSLGTFQQMWMSKAEYDEHGPGLMHRKSP